MQRVATHYLLMSKCVCFGCIQLSLLEQENKLLLDKVSRAAVSFKR